jgi:hypothetical protein
MISCFFVLENRCIYIYIYNIILYITLYNTNDDLVGVLLNRCFLSGSRNDDHNDEER